MRTLLIIPILLLFTACSAKKELLVDNAELSSINNIEGQWEGFAKKVGTNSSWDVKITNKRGNYSIDYPSLECGGTLTLKKVYSKKLEFLQKLTYGKDKCIDNGTTVISKTSPYTAEYMWYYQDEKFDAIGKLRKRK